MGPGFRAVLWVRGCPMRCAGCVSSEFLPTGRSEHAMAVRRICTWVDTAVKRRRITGVSFSGGEPFAQAEALAEVARHAQHAGLSTLAWSGFTREHLEGPRAPIGAAAFLALLDVLIDGPFVQHEASGDPLRGSRNQRIHLLTDRHRPEEFTDAVAETRITPDGRVVSTGVVDYTAFDAALALLGVR